jgi:hypothetical protein
MTLKERLEKRTLDRQEHRALMEKIHGLTGHPKAEKLYEIAWDIGHSAGYHEVEIYYDDMAELLKPNE